MWTESRGRLLTHEVKSCVSGAYVQLLMAAHQRDETRFWKKQANVEWWICRIGDAKEEEGLDDGRGEVAMCRPWHTKLAQQHPPISRVPLLQQPIPELALLSRVRYLQADSWYPFPNTVFKHRSVLGAERSCDRRFRQPQVRRVSAWSARSLPSKRPP